jgi:hypothetical protein
MLGRETGFWFYKGEFDDNVFPFQMFRSTSFPRFNNPDKGGVTDAIVHRSL